MKTMYHSLREKDRRRYAAVEAAKLGHGGLEYIADLLRCDPKTIRQGLADLAELPEVPPEVPPERCRKKGVDANASSNKIHNSKSVSKRFWKATLRAIR
ncbi:MAG: hypothetical protein WCL32_13680 [Planctomycetota bacterium]